MCLLRRDTWVPPYKSFRRGRCPHRPAAIGAASPRCKAPSGRGLSAQPTGGENTPPLASPSVSASRCHLPRRGRQGENGLPRRFAPRNDSASRRRGRRPAVERSGTNALGVRRPVCRGGRLCPPKTRAPCRAGPACPAGKNVSFAAGPMDPALQVISQGAMPTSPRRHWRGTAALQGPLWEGAVGAADWGRGNAAFYLSLRQRFAQPPPSQREARGERIAASLRSSQ